MKKNSLLVSVLLGGLALVACTPEQVVSFESLNGSKFSPESKQALISLPDVPWVFDFGRNLYSNVVLERYNSCLIFYAIYFWR